MQTTEILAINTGEIKPDNFIPPFPAEAMEIYLAAVYNGNLTKESLSVRYHNTIVATLSQALALGFGGPLSSFNIYTPQFAAHLRMLENIYVFSAAKQYQQVRTMSSFISTKGLKSSYPEFRAIAKKVFTQYNEAYLKTEYVTSIGQSQMAREWVEAEQLQDVLPYLEYRTQRDSHVRDEHAALDGITLPVGHSFWNNYMPKNGWRCRCFTVQHERKKVTDLSTRNLTDLKDETKFPKVFQMNPGKDGLVFNPKYHPYFKVAKGDANLKRNNFNLPKT